MVNIRLPDGDKGMLSSTIRREMTYHFPEGIEVELGLKYLSFTIDPAKEQTFEECYPLSYAEFITKVVQEIYIEMYDTPCAINLVWDWELEEVEYEGIPKFGNWWFENGTDEHWRAR